MIKTSNKVGRGFTSWYLIAVSVQFFNEYKFEKGNKFLLSTFYVQRNSILTKICIHRESVAFIAGSNFNCNVLSIFTEWEYHCKILSPFSRNILLKDCIEENTHFVAGVNFLREINPLKTTALHVLFISSCQKYISTANSPVELRTDHAHQNNEIAFSCWIQKPFNFLIWELLFILKLELQTIVKSWPRSGPIDCAAKSNF